MSGSEEATFFLPQGIGIGLFDDDDDDKSTIQSTQIAIQPAAHSEAVTPSNGHSSSSFFGSLFPTFAGSFSGANTPSSTNTNQASDGHVTPNFPAYGHASHYSNHVTFFHHPTGAHTTMFGNTFLKPASTSNFDRATNTPPPPPPLVFSGASQLAPHTVFDDTRATGNRGLAQLSMDAPLEDEVKHSLFSDYTAVPKQEQEQQQQQQPPRQDHKQPPTTAKPRLHVGGKWQTQQSSNANGSGYYSKHIQSVYVAKKPPEQKDNPITNVSAVEKEVKDDKQEGTGQVVGTSYVAASLRRRNLTHKQAQAQAQPQKPKELPTIAISKPHALPSQRTKNRPVKAVGDWSSSSSSSARGSPSPRRAKGTDEVSVATTAATTVTDAGGDKDDDRNGFAIFPANKAVRSRKKGLAAQPEDFPSPTPISALRVDDESDQDTPTSTPNALIEHRKSKKEDRSKRATSSNNSGRRSQRANKKDGRDSDRDLGRRKASDSKLATRKQGRPHDADGAATDDFSAEVASSSSANTPPATQFEKSFVEKNTSPQLVIRCINVSRCTKCDGCCSWCSKPILATSSLLLYTVGVFVGFVWTVMVAFGRFHMKVLGIFMLDHHSAFCFSFVYMFPYSVRTLSVWAPPWCAPCLFYAFLIQVLCIQGPPLLVAVFRVLLPLLFLTESVSHYTIFMGLSGCDRLVAAFLLSSFKSKQFFQPLYLCSLSLQIFVSVLLGPYAPAVTHWFLLVLSMMTAHYNGLPRESDEAESDDGGFHDHHALDGLDERDPHLSWLSWLLTCFGLLTFDYSDCSHHHHHHHHHDFACEANAQGDNGFRKRRTRLSYKK